MTAPNAAGSDGDGARAPLVGAEVRRREDPALLRGGGRFVDDIKRPREVAAGFVRSPHANARVRSIDTSAAARMPGVLAVYTVDDVRHLGPLIVQAALGRRRPLLADGWVKHSGEAVAMVVATDRYRAEDAAQAVVVDYEPLPAVTDVEAAATNARLVHGGDDWKTNVINTVEAGDAAAVAAAKARPDVVVVTEHVIDNRVIPFALEPRAVLADWTDDGVTVYSSTQLPFAVAGAVAKTFGLTLADVRAVAPDVGGAFGSKLNVYAEEILACFASRALSRPVRWTATRREDMKCTTHGRGWAATGTLVATRDGEIVAYELVGAADMGAYAQCFTAGIPGLGQLAALGLYKIPAAHWKIDCVATHTMSTDSYRGAGRPEAVYCLERVVDKLARALAMDPAELRRKNFWRREEFPATTTFGVVLDSGDYAATLDALLHAADVPALRRMQAEARAAGRLVGVGLSGFIEPGGVGPSAMADAGISFANYGLPAAPNETATVRVRPDGSVMVSTGTCPSGQGHQTVWSQIAADVLGVPMARISVRVGDTRDVAMGTGTFASRSAVMGGNAVALAARKVREKADAIRAAHAKDHPADPPLAWNDVVAAAFQHNKLPAGMEPGLEGTAVFDPPGLTWAYGMHLAVVEVDPDTGEITILRYLGADDCGNVINPMIVEGQVHGGLAQGIGQALYEEVVFGEDGRQLTDSLLTYRIPVAENMPEFETTRTTVPSPMNGLGLKGVGEGGAIAAPPTLAVAVLDALAPLGVEHIDMPMRPHYVWDAIQQAKQRSSAPTAA